MEFFHKQTNFPFMATRKVWYTLSAVLMIASLAALATRGLNLAIDFTGGVNAQANFATTANVDAVRAKLAAGGFRDPQVQNFGSSRDIAIRLPPDPKENENSIRAKLEPLLKAVDPSAAGDGPGSGRSAGGQRAAHQRRRGARRHAAADFPVHRLPLSHVAAVPRRHPRRHCTIPILVLGLFSFTQTSFDLPVVAAVLAVVGYSLNDTVVVFDRIRERFESNRRLPSDTVLDQSINQTLSRTIMTKVVTSIVVVALLFLGGPVLKGFSEALMVGIIAGTYSSIYISSAIALDCGLTAEHIFPTVKKTAVDHLP